MLYMKFNVIEYRSPIILITKFADQSLDKLYDKAAIENCPEIKIPPLIDFFQYLVLDIHARAHARTQN